MMRGRKRCKKLCVSVTGYRCRWDPVLPASSHLRCELDLIVGDETHRAWEVRERMNTG